MVDWVAASRGVREGQEEYRRRRAELAQAFQQFRASNPYATAQEFQQFIDGQAGGSNYVRGGAPSADVLRRVGADNQRRRAEDGMRQRLADIQARQQTMASLQAMADQSLLGMEGDDYVTLANEFAAQFGGPEALGGISIGGMFTPSRRQMLVGDRVRQYLPEALRLVETAEGRIDPSILSQAFPDIPGSVLTPLVEQTRAEWERKESERQRALALEYAGAENTIRGSIMQNPNFMVAVRGGNQQAAQAIIDSAVRPYAGVFPDRFDDAFREGLIAEATSTARQLQIAEHRQMYEAAQTQRMTVFQEIDKASVDAAASAFSATGGAPSINVGEATNWGHIAAAELARTFDFTNPATVSVLATLFAQRGVGDLNYDELLVTAREALAAARAPTLADTKQMAALNLGQNVPEEKSFADWRRSQEEDFREDIKEYEELLHNISRLDDPEAMRTQIAQTQAALANFRQVHMKEISDARTTSGSWIPVGQPGWNDSEVMGGPNSLVGVMDAETARLQEMLRALAGRASQLEDRQMLLEPVPPPRDPTLAASSAASSAADPQTGFQRTMGNIFSDAEARRELGQAANVLRLGSEGMPGGAPIGRTLDFFFREGSDPNDLRARQQEASTLLAYAQTPQAVAYLRANPDTVELLRQDPVAWVRQFVAHISGDGLSDGAARGSGPQEAAGALRLGSGGMPGGVWPGSRTLDFSFGEGSDPNDLRARTRQFLDALEAERSNRGGR
jgi:hypothetical protein